jgi:alpha-1,6-mannosyltransferase
LKILDLTEYFSPHGGIQQYLLGKARLLALLGHDHVIVAPGAADRRVELAREPGAGTSRLISISGPVSPLDPSYRVLTGLGRVRAFIAEFRPDVLQIHSMQLAALLLCMTTRRHARLRSIFWHTDFVDAYVTSGLDGRGGGLLAPVASRASWAWVRLVARSADLVWVTSRQQQLKLGTHGISRTELLPFGFDRDLYSPTRKSLSWRREMFGGRPDAVLLLAVGRLTHEKRFDVILDAFFVLRQRVELVLVIYGEGPERAALERRCAGRDDVRFCGFEADPECLAQAMASADLLIHAAPFETFGMTLAQALLCGLPLVVPDAGAAVDLADASCAERYTAGSAAACAEAVLRLLARDRGSLRVAARARGERLPTPAEHVKRLVDVQRAALERRT